MAHFVHLALIYNLQRQKNYVSILHIALLLICAAHFEPVECYNTSGKKHDQYVHHFRPQRTSKATWLLDKDKNENIKKNNY